MNRHIKGFFESKEKAKKLIMENELTESQIVRETGLPLHTINRIKCDLNYSDPNNIEKDISESDPRLLEIEEYLIEQNSEDDEFIVDVFDEKLYFNPELIKKPFNEPTLSNAMRYLVLKEGVSAKPQQIHDSYDRLRKIDAYNSLPEINRNCCAVLYYRVRNEFLKGVYRG